MLIRHIRILLVSLLFVVATILAGCDRHTSAWGVMDGAEAIMEESPDSALSVLSRIDKETLGGNEERARYALLMSMAIDKNYMDTTTFDVLQPAIDYYIKEGTPDEKLRTYYYQGRIYQNAGDRDNAMSAFAKALDNTQGVKDSLCLARTLVAQAALYDAFYDYEAYMNNHLSAAKIYNKCNFDYYEFDCLINALNGAIALENKSVADSILNLCDTLELLDEESRQKLHRYKLSCITKFSTKEELADFLNEPNEEVANDAEAFLSHALAYNKLGENVKAKQYLASLYDSGVRFDTLRYLAISVVVSRDLGDFENAFSVYWDFSHKMDSINSLRFEQKSKSIEEKHALELQAQKEAQQKNKIIWGCVGLAMLLCIIALVYFLHVKRLTVEHANDLLKIQNLQNNLFETGRRQEEISGKIENLFIARFKLLDGLASSYFECKETGQEQKRIYAEVKTSLSDFSSEATTQELVDAVNEYKGGLMDNFKADYPKLSASQCRLALYIFCGFSLPSISIFIDTDLRNLYVYKSRLKSVVAKSDSPRKEEYLKYFA